MGRKKLLYIMGIDWNWIYQRPQVIGRHLEKSYDVTVIFPKSVLKWRLGDEVDCPKRYRILWTLPFQEKNSVVGYLSQMLSRSFFRHMGTYDGVIIGYPLYYRYIPSSYRGKIIYDCMDNHEALYPYKKGVDKVLVQEGLLLQQCDALVTSCQKLYDKMMGQVKKDVAARIIRNGANVDLIVEPHKGRLAGGKYKIGYFGTLAGWFDYNLLEKSLAIVDDIEYHLIGPCEGKKPLEEHPCLAYEGTVPHDELYQKTMDYACLIMPFIVNDIVEWVDPVKLYEYIALGKCIVSVYYMEIDRFKDYVYFYRTHEEYIKLIENLKENYFPPKYTSKQQKEFLQANSWECRLKEWDDMMESIGL